MEQFLLKCLQEAFGMDVVVARDREVVGEELDIYMLEVGLAVEPGS